MISVWVISQNLLRFFSVPILLLVALWQINKVVHRLPEAISAAHPVEIQINKVVHEVT